MRAAAIAFVLTACGQPAHAADAGPGAPDADLAAPDAAPLPPSDPFDGSALDPRWTVLDPSKVTATVGGGQLVLTPAANALWFDAGVGGLAYQLVAGDFTATTTVHVHKASDTSMPPDQAIELGGVMARAPTAAENYVLVVVGFAEMGHLAAEHKTTTDGTSTWDETPFAAEADLRLCRHGQTITVYRRALGASAWTQDFQIARPDFPATLQVGPTAYDGEGAPDVAAAFDAFTFAPLPASGDCTT
jgi:hypothetical protein